MFMRAICEQSIHIGGRAKHPPYKSRENCDHTADASPLRVRPFIVSFLMPERPSFSTGSMDGVVNGRIKEFLLSWMQPKKLGLCLRGEREQQGLLK
jgi:hypothetical protein